MRFFLTILLLLFFGIESIAGSFAVTTTSQALHSCTNTSTQMLAGDSARTYVLIQNQGSANVTVTFGHAQQSTEGVIIPSGGAYEPIKSDYDSIYCKSSSGTQSIMILTGK